MVMNESTTSTYPDLEAGFSSHLKNNRRASYRAMPVAASFFVEDTADEKPHHFLDACALCMMPLRPNRDIYMYRGDMPFCSQECRQEQIEMDEAMEKSRRLSASLKTQKKSSSAASPPKSQSIHIRAGTVVVS